MSYHLISLCPNCRADTSRNNKVLYDGIFLICHECGHGWYYNIQTFEIKNKNSYNSKSTPLNTLHNSIKNYKAALNKKHSNTGVIRNSAGTKNINHINGQPKTKKPLNITTSYSNTNSDTSYSTGNVDKYATQNNENSSLYNANKEYSGNLYFKSSDSKTLQNKQNISSSDSPTRNPDPINSSVNKASDAKNLSTNNKKETLKNIPLRPSSHEKSKTLQNKQNISSSDSPTRNPDPINSSVNKASDAKNLSTNNKKATLNSIPLNSSSLTNSKTLQNKQNISSSDSPTRDPDPINSSVNNFYEQKLQKSLKLDYSEDIAKVSLSSLRSSNKLNEKNFNKAVNDFNQSLNTKETLGLKNNNNMLLNFEATNKYNIENYKEPFINKKKLTNEINNITKQLNSCIISLCKSILSIFTRLDLLLKTLAYCTILFSAIGFLAFSEYKKKTKVSMSDLKNSSYQNDFSKEQTSNITIPENSNDIAKVSKIYNVNDSLDSKNEVNLKTDVDQAKHIDVKEYSLDKRKENNIKSLNKSSNNYENQDLTFMQLIKSSLSNGFYALKSMQQNAFSNVKITKNSIKWKEITKNNFYLSTSLTNYSNSSNYIVKTLLVKFVNKSGQTLGQRIIETNQVINNNSAVNINLTINNVPNNTNKIYTFINNKQKLS